MNIRLPVKIAATAAIIACSFLVYFSHKGPNPSAETGLIGAAPIVSNSIKNLQVIAPPAVVDAAPETEAALNKFGLSTTSIFKLSVTAKLKS